MVRLRSPRKSAESSEAERYRRSATQALTLLDWCIEYLADNGQGKIARQFARNRRHISGRLQRR
jgi:hypothetical protein